MGLFRKRKLRRKSLQAEALFDQMCNEFAKEVIILIFGININTARKKLEIQIFGDSGFIVPRDKLVTKSLFIVYRFIFI